jgi:hypothetical protein
MKPKLRTVRQIACLLILLISTFIFSCKDDETISPIVGTWIIVSAKFTECADGSNSAITYWCEPENCSKQTYTADGKLIFEDLVKGVTTLLEGTYTISGNTINVNTNFQGNPMTSTYTFTVTENSLSLSTPAPYTGYNCVYKSFWSK